MSKKTIQQSASTFFTAQRKGTTKLKKELGLNEFQLQRRKAAREFYKKAIERGLAPHSVTMNIEQENFVLYIKTYSIKQTMFLMQDYLMCLDGVDRDIRQYINSLELIRLEK